jgi:membrane fusion protein (multidrug efflux system)
MSDTPPDTLDASSDSPPRVDNRNDSGETKKPESKSSPVPNSKANDEGKSDEAKRKARRPTVAVIGIAVIALLLIGGASYWWTTRNLESTDDAYTDGRAVTIAPQVSGAVVSLDVTDNQFVKKDQPLIHIDPRQYIIDRDQAVAALDTAKAQYAGQ